VATESVHSQSWGAGLWIVNIIIRPGGDISGGGGGCGGVDIMRECGAGASTGKLYRPKMDGARMTVSSNISL
jgi:hypothetical protein